MARRYTDQHQALPILIAPSGADVNHVATFHVLYARYAGQGHEVTVPLPAGPIDAAAVAQSLYGRYRREYGIE